MSMDSDPAALMSRRIFRLDLSVEAVSLYLLCCALADNGQPVPSERVAGAWNGTPADLRRAAAELQSLAIVETADTGGYRVNAESRWRLP